MHYGVSWYPEMWPASEWAGDVARMAEVGFTLVRVFEFAWKRFEPSEGVFDFAWARQVLDLLHAAGIQAMLGTPTAAPPAWLTTAYPEVLKTGSDGKVRGHGQRDLLHPSGDYSGYRLIIAPQLSILSADARQRLRDWVETGGRLLLGPMSGTRTPDMTLWTDSDYGGLEELMGADQALRFSPHWVEESIDVAFADGTSCHPRIWCEAFAPREGTDVLASYRGGYGDGLPAVVSRHLGKGRVISLGCPLDEPCFQALFDLLAREADIRPMAEGGEGVLCCPRVDAEGKLTALGLVNTRKTPASIRLPFAGTDLLENEYCEGELEMAPLQVRLLRYDAKESR